ncbi:AcsC protein [Halomonas huangheensis]|nr:AcsC protein [Halomonas huangheensis]
MQPARDPADPRETSIEVPFTASAQWRHHARVEQRVIGQLLQTLLYEQVLSYSESSIFPRNDPQGQGSDGNRRFLIEIADSLYQIDGWLCDSFELIRLDYASICIVTPDGAEQAPSFQRLVIDLKAQLGSDAMQPGFINELEQTLVKDVQSAAWQLQGTENPQQLDADALEHYFTDAHSYHPCYKSRLGFSLQDNRRYGPEFALPIRLLWLAVPKQLAHCSSVDRIATREFVDAEAGPEVLARLTTWLDRRQLTRDEVVLIPVHPWQWSHITVSTLYPELASEEIYCLGQGEAIYTAQQSIRTLAPRERQRPYVKLSLSITNTSSTRILARHTITNGPIITQWLQQLVATDDTARGLGFAILGEIAGAALDERAFDTSRYAGVYGTLGAIWRENVSGYLRAGEQAVPLNGLSQQQRHADGSLSPFIQPWIERYGLKAWTRQLVQVSVLPIIHMLYAEGLGMESHGQNIVVIHRDGWPLRIAIKDFHDGVRYSPQHLARPELAPELEPLPASHAALNRNSFIITDDVNAVRDFSCDAFFFIALAEMAIFLRRYFALEEGDFWAMTADVVVAYQQSHPQHHERFELFDVFAPTYDVEALTKRRLFGDAELQARVVPNPLAPFKPAADRTKQATSESAEAIC